MSTAFAIVGALVVLVVIVGFALRRSDGRRRDGGTLRIHAEHLNAPLAATATLVQFSTQMCARCPQVRRLLGEIAADNDGVGRIEIDLTDRNDLAAQYRILQTPTTFLVDASGAVLSRWAGIPNRYSIEDAIAAASTTAKNPAPRKQEQS